MEIINHKPFQLKPLPDNAGEVLSEVTKRLQFNFWLSAGTALGLYRDGDLIANDTDLDVAVVGWEGIGEAIKEQVGWEVLREVNYQGKPQQIAFIKDELIFDVYIHWPEGDNMVNYGESGKQVMPKWMYNSLKWKDTKYGLMPFPSDPEAYFKIRYGDDWQTPQEKKPKFEEI